MFCFLLNLELNFFILATVSGSFSHTLFLSASFVLMDLFDHLMVFHPLQQYLSRDMTKTAK